MAIEEKHDGQNKRSFFKNIISGGDAPLTPLWLRHNNLTIRHFYYYYSYYYHYTYYYE